MTIWLVKQNSFRTRCRFLVSALRLVQSWLAPWSVSEKSGLVIAVLSFKRVSDVSGPIMPPRPKRASEGILNGLRHQVQNLFSKKRHPSVTRHPKRFAPPSTKLISKTYQGSFDGLATKLTRTVTHCISKLFFETVHSRKELRIRSDQIRSDLPVL